MPSRPWMLTTSSTSVTCGPNSAARSGWRQAERHPERVVGVVALEEPAERPHVAQLRRQRAARRAGIAGRQAARLQQRDPVQRNHARALVRIDLDEEHGVGGRLGLGHQPSRVVGGQPLVQLQRPGRRPDDVRRQPRRPHLVVDGPVGLQAAHRHAVADPIDAPHAGDEVGGVAPRPAEEGVVGRLDERLDAGRPQHRGRRDRDRGGQPGRPDGTHGWPRVHRQAPYSYSDIGGHAQINWRSPRALSMRPTVGHTLRALTNGSGNAACCRL